MIQPPHDPNDPNFSQFEAQDTFAGGADDSLRTGAPVISSAPSRIVFILIAAVIAIIVVGFMVVHHGPKGPSQKPTKPSPIAKPIADETPPQLQPSILPPPPPLQSNPMPSINPKTTFTPTGAATTAGGPTDQQRQKRIRSEMLISSGGGRSEKTNTADRDEAQARDNYNSTDSNLGFASRAYSGSKAKKVYAGNVGNLNNLILQGKLIHAVLETAVNTTLPAQVRAIVSHDIYAEQGRNVLIPKGSRLIGVYSTNVLRGQDRVYFAWTRLIRPDGIDIYIASAGADALGRGGEEGYLDSKYREIFTGAILSSVLTIGLAGIVDAAGGDKNVSTSSNTDGSTTSSGNSLSYATLDAVGQLGNVGKRVVDGLLDLRPTITIDQGTEINVMVQQDLHFPPNLTNRAMIVE